MKSLKMCCDNMLSYFLAFFLERIFFGGVNKKKIDDHKNKYEIKSILSHHSTYF